MPLATITVDEARKVRPVLLALSAEHRPLPASVPADLRVAWRALVDAWQALTVARRRRILNIVCISAASEAIRTENAAVIDAAGEIL